MTEEKGGERFIGLLRLPHRLKDAWYSGWSAVWGLGRFLWTIWLRLSLESELKIMMITYLVVHLHSDFPVVTCRSEHTWIRRVPSNSVDAARGMAFESFDQRSVLFVPYIDFGICRQISISYLHWLRCVYLHCH